MTVSGAKKVTELYSGPERRAQAHLTEDQIEDIAEKAADKAIEKLTGDVYKAVGKSVVSKFLWIVGASAVGVWIWAKKNGLVP